jgi:hypothetical protein
MPRKSVALVQFPAYGTTSKFLLNIIVRRFNSIVLVYDLNPNVGDEVTAG